MESLASLQKGHEFPAAEFELSREWARNYIAAVEDRAIQMSGTDAVPPMAVAALSVRALLEVTGLPPGAIHAGQDLVFRHAVRAGDRLSASARIASRGERSGWVLMGIDMTVARGTEEVMSGRAVLTFPLEAGA